MPSWLTSIIFSSIHLIIHVHGKFLKKSVAELEAEWDTGFVKSTGPWPSVPTGPAHQDVIR